MKAKTKRMPRGFRVGHCGDIACPHRDLTCCPDCAEAHEEVVNVFGQHFWVADAAERAELKRDIDKTDLGGGR